MVCIHTLKLFRSRKIFLKGHYAAYETAACNVTRIDLHHGDDTTQNCEQEQPAHTANLACISLLREKRRKERREERQKFG